MIKQPTTKELNIHTLVGDIQESGMTGMSKRQIRRFLEKRYVNLETDITEEDFSETLDREYDKVLAWRTSK